MLHTDCYLSPSVQKGRWSKEEDKALTWAVRPHLTDGTLSTEDNLPWNRIAQYVPNRTGTQCQARWTEALDPSIRKGRWRKEEDDMLKIGVEKFGCCWIRVAGSIPGRTQRQCRTRWNQMQPKRYKAHDASPKLTHMEEQQQQQKNKKKHADGHAAKLHFSSYQQNTINVLSITPIQLESPSKTPYILLNKQQKAIVIPSEIPSPLSSLTSAKEDDYFCTSPALTSSSSDTIISSNNSQQLPLSVLTTVKDAATLNDFNPSFPVQTDKKSNHDTLFNSMFPNQVLNRFEPDSSSLMLPSIPLNHNHTTQPHYHGTISLENLFRYSESF